MLIFYSSGLNFHNVFIQAYVKTRKWRKMLALQQYSSDEDGSDNENKDSLEDLTAHLKPISQKDSLSSSIQLKAAPDIFTKVKIKGKFT